MWISITLQASAPQAETLSDALLQAGALSIDIADAAADTPAEQAQFCEPGEQPQALWAQSRITALFDQTAAIDDILATAALQIGLDSPPPHVRTSVAEQNWVQLTQQQFAPLHITDGLWIVPSWHRAPDPTAINIALDPGMAFGTGSHATTRLCLQWLAQRITPACSVLDYGCGSGILGVAAARLGASKVVCVDIDEKALEAARDNAQRNQVHLHFQHSGKSLQRRFDLVVANILTAPLCLLAPLLSARLAPCGSLALSGILDTQAQQVIAAYAPYIELHIGASDDAWVRLENTPPSNEER